MEKQFVKPSFLNACAKKVRDSKSKFILRGESFNSFVQCIKISENLINFMSAAHNVSKLDFLAIYSALAQLFLCRNDYMHGEWFDGVLKRN